MSADIAPRPQFVAAPPLPEFVQIEPVGQCNLRCQMCAIQFRRDGPPHGPLAFMAFETFTRLLDQFPRLRELHLQGLGEPTMHPRFFDMVAHAAARGIRVSTNSNLTLWSERRALQCAQSGLAELSVSLDAADPSIYERIRRGAHFGKVLRNLRRVMAARAATRSPLEVRIVMVLMKQNLDDLPNLVRLAAARGRAGHQSALPDRRSRSPGDCRRAALCAPDLQRTGFATLYRSGKAAGRPNSDRR